MCRPRFASLPFPKRRIEKPGFSTPVLPGAYMVRGKTPTVHERLWIASGVTLRTDHRDRDTSAEMASVAGSDRKTASQASVREQRTL